MQTKNWVSFFFQLKSNRTFRRIPLSVFKLTKVEVSASSQLSANPLWPQLTCPCPPWSLISLCLSLCHVWSVVPVRSSTTLGPTDHLMHSLTFLTLGKAQCKGFKATLNLCSEDMYEVFWSSSQGDV